MRTEISRSDDLNAHVGLREGRLKLGWLNAAKGAGAILVVAGHSSGDIVGLAPLRNAIFLFHMPLFFMISGFLFKPDQPKTYLYKKSISLLVPYATFLMILAITSVGHIVYDLAVNHFLNTDRLFPLIYGGQLLKGTLTVFWFVTVLWGAQCLYNLARRNFGSATDVHFIFFICIMFAAAYFLPVMGPVPWNFSVVPMAIVFLWAGELLRQQLFSARPTFNSALTLMLIISALSVAGVWAGFRFDMKTANYGPPIVGAVLAVLLSALFVQAWKLAPPGNWQRPFERVGDAAIVVMFLHQLFRTTIQNRLPDMNPELELLVQTCVGVVMPFITFLLLQRFSVTRLLFLGQRPNASRLQSG